MELLMLFVALFVFLFGSAIAMKAIEFGFEMVDKALAAIGYLMKLPFLIVFKLITFAVKACFMKAVKQKSFEYKVKPMFDVTPLELQQLRNRNLIQSKQEAPVLIEFSPQLPK